MSQLSLSEWNTFLSAYPEAHLLQTGSWGELKANFGWEAIRLEHTQGNRSWGAQILFRQLPLGYTFAYLPKGPLTMEQGEEIKYPFSEPIFWHEIDQLCRSKRAVFLKVEPDGWIGKGESLIADAPESFHLSPQSIQPARTIIVDLSASEEEILARMKQKTRYNIRLAGKKGIKVDYSDDVRVFYELMEATAQRDQFGIHSYEYYQKAFDLFNPSGRCVLLLAAYEGQPIAGLMAFASGGRSWYLFGASSSQHRERMPTYLLQWEAMKWARSKGCLSYDLYGVPDHNVEYLEEHFKRNSQGLWGIYRFKRGFGGQVVSSTGSWDRVYNSFLYQIYLRWYARAAGDDSQSVI